MLNTRTFRTRTHRNVVRAARCALEPLERRTLMCGLPQEFLIDAPEWSDAIEQQARDRLASQDGPEADGVIINWTNKDTFNDLDPLDNRFDNAFGTSAPAAQKVVQAALDHWARVITNWNRTLPNGLPDPDMTLQVNISIGGTGFGGGGSPAPIAPPDGRPRTGSFTLGAGNPVGFPDPDDSNGWYLDPNPNDHAEFNGALVNPYSGNATGAIGPDFYSLAVAELTHVLGLISDMNNNGGAWQGYRLESSGMATNTTIPDNADGAGTFWAFDGPTIDHLMTSFNGGGTWGNIVHSAGPAGNINFSGRNWRGSASAGNGRANGGRTIPDFAMAHVLADAYGYSIKEPWEFDTFHYLLNRDSPANGGGELRIRGGQVNTLSGDVITLGTSGSDITVSVDVGNDVPGTGALSGVGNLPAFTAKFPRSEVTSINIAALDGIDTINIESAFPGIPILVDGGIGNDTINLTPTSDNLDFISAALTIQGNTDPGNTDNDTLVLHDTANVFADTYQITNMTLDRDVIQTMNYNGLETIQIDSGSGGAVFNVTSLLSITTLNLNTGGGNDSVNIGAGTLNADLVDGNINLFGQGGTNDVLIWHDESNTSTATYTVTSSSLTRTGAGTVTYGTIEVIVIEGGSGTDIIEVTSTAATTRVTARGNGGNDQFQLAYGNLNTLPALVHVEGGAGVNTAVLRDHLTFDNDGFTVTATQISQPGFGGLIYSDLTTLTVEAGSGNNAFTVNSTSSVTDIRLKGNAGNDFYEVNSTSPIKPVIIDAGSGTTNVINSIPAASAALVIENNQTLQSLTLIGNARASIAGGAVIRTQFLTVISGARLDIGTSSVIVDYSGSSPLSAINSLLTSGYNGGAWNGVGINSSTAAASGNTGIGIAEATDLFSTFPATFAGQSIDNTSILLKYTYKGDTNLDGSVNLTDFNRLAANFGLTARRWIHGDSDYDGTANLSDFNRLATNFGSSGLWPDHASEPQEILPERRQQDELEIA